MQGGKTEKKKTGICKSTRAAISLLALAFASLSRRVVLSPSPSSTELSVALHFFCLHAPPLPLPLPLSHCLGQIIYCCFNTPHGLCLDRIGHHRSLSLEVFAPIQMTLLPFTRCSVLAAAAPAALRISTQEPAGCFCPSHRQSSSSSSSSLEAWATIMNSQASLL